MIHHQNHPFLSHVEQQQPLKQAQPAQQPQAQLHSQQQQLSSSTSPSSNDSSLSEANSNNLNSRVSPASTALVMSSNNINGHSISRQLTPNTSSSNQGGTNSSSGTSSSHSPTQQQSGQQNPANNVITSAHNSKKATAPKSNRPQQAPNPMVRQSFANCHAKSMSAGVVVSVPGISTNLGAHRNIIKPNSHHPPNPHRPLPLDPDICQQQQHQHQQQHQLQQKLHVDSMPMNPAAMQDNQHVQPPSSQLNYHSRSGSANNNNNNHLVQQQVIREHQTLNRNHQAHDHGHHRQQSQPNTLNHQLIAQQQNSHNQEQLQQQQQHHHQIFNSRTSSHHNQQLQQNHHINQQQQATSFNVNSEKQHFQQTNQASNSTIMLSNRNINQLHHNRSASAQLAHHHQHHHEQPQQVIMNNHHLSNSNNNNNNLNVPSNYPCHITANANSIWSIDENISKSQGKLTSSGFLNNPSCLFSNSITDVSCDNLSNASRLLDPAGAACPPAPPNPASAYYLHHHSRNLANNLPNNNAISNSGLSIKRAEFLPFCDLMFNFISMIIYFCENTFGIIALIALYYHTHYTNFALVGTAFVLVSNVTSQYLSFKWLYSNKLDECYRKREAQEELEDEEGCERRYYGPSGMNPDLPSYQCGACTWLPYDGTKVQIRFLLSIILDGLLHLLCLGFLLRYIKLVIPITDTARVKRDGRDLCMLRMTHAFVQSTPLLLLQSYLICSQGSSITVTNLSLTSAILSLINVCWALASFTKYARKKYSHKFVLTWLGIVSQFMWRLGTISSRVVALTIYAVYFGYWVLMIMLLHWIVMFVWLIQPGNLFKDETHLTKPTKTFYAAIVGWIYCFCYVNFEELNSKIKIIVYYAIMFLQNNLLLTLSLIFSTNTGWFKNISILIVYLGFVIGITFMLLYYKHMHATVLNSGLSCSRDSVDSIADQLTSAGKKIAGFKPGTLRLKSDDNFSAGHRFDNNIGATLHTGSHPEITRTIKPPYLTTNQMEHTQSGVFDPKPAQLWERKQKLPSSHQRRQ